MRTAAEWAQLFSDSLCSTNPVTIEMVVQNAMDETTVVTRDKTMKMLRVTLISTPYFFQPEIVDDIIQHIKLHPMVLA